MTAMCTSVGSSIYPWMPVIYEEMHMRQGNIERNTYETVTGSQAP